MLALVLCGALAGEAGAQSLPTEPIALADGRVIFSAEVFANLGEADPGWFNYNDYEYGAFRNVRAAVSTEMRASRRLQLLAEVRLDHGRDLAAYALFLRLRPWPDRQFDVQVGRVPPTFGAFTKTAYSYHNVVVGQPLAYQYLLSLKPTAVPRSADDLLRMRGNGWLSDFPVGDPTPSPGVPIVNTARYDTGIQVHGVAGLVEWTGAVTAGSPSAPRLSDNNGRPQLAGRVVVRAAPVLRIGASLASGPWLDDSLDAQLPSRARDHKQSAVALDAELSRGAWLVRTEWLRSSWSLPALAAPVVPDAVAAQSLIVEGRYRLWPGVSLAARADALWFSELRGTSRVESWDADVRRVETAVSVALTRTITTKVALQHNRRSGGRILRDSLLVGQIAYWF